jgi:hypothetical protein
MGAGSPKARAGSGGQLAPTRTGVDEGALVGGIGEVERGFAAVPVPGVGRPLAGTPPGRSGVARHQRARACSIGT